MATMLDSSFGTYPYTVANNTLVSSLFISAGIRPCPLHVLGVIKAYTTRVGHGPFPTEQQNEQGKTLQQYGREVAATSGRIRRCGWLDLPIIRYAHSLNRFSALAITKLDVLSVFDTIPVCVSYQVGKKVISEFPAITHDYARCVPIYIYMKGWKKDISKVRTFKELPAEAKAYVRFIQHSLSVPLKFISVGAERNATIIL